MVSQTYPVSDDRKSILERVCQFKFISHFSHYPGGKNFKNKKVKHLLLFTWQERLSDLHTVSLLMCPATQQKRRLSDSASWSHACPQLHTGPHGSHRDNAHFRSKESCLRPGQYRRSRSRRNSAPQLCVWSPAHSFTQPLIPAAVVHGSSLTRHCWLRLSTCFDVQLVPALTIGSL